MSTVVTIGGRVIWDTTTRQKPVEYRNKRGEVFDPWDCPQDPVAQKYAAGTVREDEVDHATYRVVSIALEPADGWASAAFWTARWKLVKPEFLALVRLGYLDAAIEYGSAAKRYRCLNEASVLESQIVKEARLRRAGVPRRPAPQTGVEPTARARSRWESGKEIR
jgi:hypothetical protein